MSCRLLDYTGTTMAGPCSLAQMATFTSELATVAAQATLMETVKTPLHCLVRCCVSILVATTFRSTPNGTTESQLRIPF